MNIRYWLFFIIFQVIFDSSLCVDYCAFNQSHVLCGDVTFHPRCGDKILYKDYSHEEKKRILDIHNEFRNQVALGSLNYQGLLYFPEAADMEELVWDEELAEIASGSVKRCLFEHTYLECRRSSKFKCVGENLNDMTTTSPLEQLYKYATVDRVTAGWRKEKDLFPPNEVHKYPTGRNELGYTSLQYGHFAQMIWANTTNIGCAKIGFVNQNNKSETIFACLYGETGNYQNEPVYNKGKTCTRCRGVGKKCSQKYIGLCDAGRNLNESYPFIEELEVYYIV